MLLSFWSALIAQCIPLSRLLFGVHALLRALLTPILSHFTLSESSCLAVDSVAAMMSVKGIHLGATAKLRPKASTAISHYS